MGNEPGGKGDGAPLNKLHNIIVNYNQLPETAANVLIMCIMIVLSRTGNCCFPLTQKIFLCLTLRNYNKLSIAQHGLCLTHITKQYEHNIFCMHVAT